jgi:hypothetical protein
MLSSRNFLALNFTLRSVIGNPLIELIFMNNIRSESGFGFFIVVLCKMLGIQLRALLTCTRQALYQWTIPQPWIGLVTCECPVVERTVFAPLNYLCSFIKDQLTLCVDLSSGLSILVPLICLPFYQYHTIWSLFFYSFPKSSSTFNKS